VPLVKYAQGTCNEMMKDKVTSAWITREYHICIERARVNPAGLPWTQQVLCSAKSREVALVQICAYPNFLKKIN